MSSDWDEEEDQAKDKDQKQPQTSPSFFTMMTKPLQPPKPYITIYFNNMTSKTSITYTPKEKHRHDTIMAQKELYTTEHKALDQDSQEGLD